MPIHLDQLPSERPEANFKLLDAGTYEFVIEKAEIKVSNNGNEYMQVTLVTDDGDKLWDNIMYTDNPHVQFKFTRFLRACKVPLQGSLEFKDIKVLVEGARVKADVIQEEQTYKGNTQTRNIIDLFNGDCYYPIDDEEAVPFSEGTQGTY